ncbi:copper homeostasis protein [Virgibacillus halotolerans]|uniref:copper homeostasis protein CutC n=1 Tax=Virgibacillus halotolerans TaxID=1071053 RepID=UPI00195FFCDD|nr:copper homeostasis protein CutC [Virgibacillus halotolerans]MBM7600004.1 copper homeostasis protein [Virgibacillus halotolerans]
MVLEVIATNLTDVKQATRYGANRLELSPSMSELGITPSFGLIKAAVKAVDIPINVIVRPHSQSFQYNEDDLTSMITDIEMIKELGANGIVIGALTDKGTVDEETLKQLLDVSGDLDVTFHRAFDFARNQREALACLSNYPQVTHILTAGGNYDAPDAVNELNQLVEDAKDTNLTIMAGHGLRVDTFKDFYNQVKVKEVHFGSGVRVNNSFRHMIDSNKVKRVKDILRER